jgi:hypothetical protein
VYCACQSLLPKRHEGSPSLNFPEEPVALDTITAINEPPRLPVFEDR